MNELTKKQKIVAAIASAILSAILTIAAGWALGEAIDYEIDAHSASAFPEYVEADQ